jgi:hypothetical protein
MLYTFAAFLGIVCAVIAILVMLRALTVHHLVRACTRGLKAILAFVVLGAAAQMLLPGVLTRGFIASTSFSLFLGFGLVVLALALVLIAKFFSSAGNSLGGK